MYEERSDGVEADRGHGDRGVGAASLEEPPLERDAADLGRRGDRRERTRELHRQVRADGQGFDDRARQRERCAQVGRGRGQRGHGDPRDVGVLQFAPHLAEAGELRGNGIDRDQRHDDHQHRLGFDPFDGCERRLVGSRSFADEVADLLEHPAFDLATRASRQREGLQAGERAGDDPRPERGDRSIDRRLDPEPFRRPRQHLGDVAGEHPFVAGQVGGVEVDDVHLAVRADEDRRLVEAPVGDPRQTQAHDKVPDRRQDLRAQIGPRSQRAAVDRLVGEEVAPGVDLADGFDLGGGHTVAAGLEGDEGLVFGQFAEAGEGPSVGGVAEAQGPVQATGGHGLPAVTSGDLDPQRLAGPPADRIVVSTAGRAFVVHVGHRHPEAGQGGDDCGVAGATIGCAHERSHEGADDPADRHCHDQLAEAGRAREEPQGEEQGQPATGRVAPALGHPRRVGSDDRGDRRQERCTRERSSGVEFAGDPEPVDVEVEQVGHDPASDDAAGERRDDRAGEATEVAPGDERDEADDGSEDRHELHETHRELGHSGGEPRRQPDQVRLGSRQ